MNPELEAQAEAEARRQRAQFSSKRVDTDKLPPHSIEGEQGVLGCILLDPGVLRMAQERFAGEMEVFYDLRHRCVYQALDELDRRGIPIDIISLQNRLTERKELDQVGGIAWLASLPDTVPSAANISYYIEMVWEYFLLRRKIQLAQRTIQRVYAETGGTEIFFARTQREEEEFNRLAERGAVTPKYLAPAGQFADECMAQLFRDPRQGEPGLELPIRFPLRIRRQETTLLSADDKSGKSTLLSYFSLHLAAQEKGCCIASFEEPPPISLWRLASQLLGAKHLPDSTAGRKRAVDAVAWLNARFWFYNFLGISHWQDVLDTFRYAADKHGVWLFIIDSVMRIGIPDDDYAQQANAAAAFAKFALDTRSHLWFVIHENKSDGKAKAKIRGSKLWSANANNILQVERNLQKGEKADDLRWKLDKLKRLAPDKQDPEEIKELEEKIGGLRMEWDTHLVLRGQRWLGSQQNASKRFWFDRENFQFRDRWEDTAVDWLARWRGDE